MYGKRNFLPARKKGKGMRAISIKTLDAAPALIFLICAAPVT
jgi:hypothetical protein